MTICLVIGVIFFFLRNVSATLIPSLAVPLSLLGTFAAMKLLGFTIDMLSMMAMTLSVGFVVDDAIVMLENIVRHMEMGKPRMQAAYRRRARSGIHDYFDDMFRWWRCSSRCCFMSGIIGRLLREFSITIAVAILISGCYFVDAYADAVQPVPPPRQRAGRHGSLRGGRKSFSSG